MTGDKFVDLLHQTQSSGMVNTISLEILPTVELQNSDLWEEEMKKANDNIDYRRAVQIAYSLYSRKTNPLKKITYGIYLAQYLINASNLNKATEILNEIAKTANDPRSLSAIYEKLGWVADCQEKPLLEMEYFKKARNYVEQIPEAERTSEDRNRLLTIEHFMGRALIKKVRQKLVPEETIEDLQKAKNLFISNLNGYQALGNRKDAEAFNEAWLARVAIEQDDLPEAQRLVDLARSHFEGTSQTLSHYHRVAGELAIAQKRSDEAFNHGLRALELTLPPGLYFNGVIEAVTLLVRALLLSK